MDSNPDRRDARTQGRSSEKVFWRTVLDIYAASIDHDPRVEASQRFFKTVQNMMHSAVQLHGRRDRRRAR
jgi:hypothetical protein